MDTELIVGKKLAKEPVTRGEKRRKRCSPKTMIFPAAGEGSASALAARHAMMEEMSPVCSYSTRVSWDKVDPPQLAEMEHRDADVVDAAVAAAAAVAMSTVVSREDFLAFPFFLASLGAMVEQRERCA